MIDAKNVSIPYSNLSLKVASDTIQRMHKFIKELQIFDVFEVDNKFITAPKIPLETKNLKKEATKQSTFKVEFFPEGGSLLENVASVVGFKAVDLKGKPIEIKGEIHDSSDELVASFESAHDGMGKLQILPMEGKKYFAKIKSPSGEELKVELPSVLKQGFLLSFRAIKVRNIISISTNQATLAQNPNQVLTVIGKAKGIRYLETTQTLTETTSSFEVPNDKIPDGISQITLFDNTNKPQSERLIYVEKKHDLEVELVIDKSTYLPEEKTVINVSSKSKSGTVKSASFSLSVTDMNGMEEDNKESNISSYFLMESDIRGKVYHPSYYFDTNNLKRLEYLDNLLLTQGWRDFLWKTTPKLDDKISYAAEKGITISGRVKQVFTDKPLVNNNLILALMSKNNNGIFNATTDSIGRFQFKNLMFSDQTNMYINSINEKGKFSGQIVLDSIEHSPIKAKLKKEIIVFPETNQSIVENVSKKHIAFGVKPENILNQVEVKAQKNKINSWYGVPDYSYKVDKKEVNKFYNFADYLE